jgi:hypothetical protein
LQRQMLTLITNLNWKPRNEFIKPLGVAWHRFGGAE